MASFSPHKRGWRAQVARKGVRKSKVLASKGAAVAWAGQVESEIMAGDRGEIPNFTVKALFERYAEKVSKGKKGERWEVIRLKALGRDRLAQVRLRVLDAPHVSDWQERRLQAVSSASVRRERNLLNHVFQIAIKEWRWLKKNPFLGVRRTKDGKARGRIATQAELDKLCGMASDQLRKAIVVAVETAMRAGEIASQPPIRGRVAHLLDSKNSEGRPVPLSPAALEALPGINITAGSISAMFAELTEKAGIEDLTFHDLKHTAMTRLSKKMDAWDLCKMSGNKDINLVLRVYYKSDPEAVADKLT